MTQPRMRNNMNTRSNVLEEFNANGITYPVDTVDHMADEIVRLRDRIRELEARVDDEQKYVVTLHRMIEAHCRGERVSNSDSPYIAAMLNANLSEAASEPVAWVRKKVYADGSHELLVCSSDANGSFPVYTYPSAAAVSVTDAMVEAAAHALRDGFRSVHANNEGNNVWRGLASISIHAALQPAASEGASA